MSNSSPQSEKRVRPFADFLAEHNAGQGHRQAGETLQELAAAVIDTGKKGSMSVTVSVEPMKGSEGTLVTTIVVASKIPMQAPKSAVFYADAEGNLTRNDPAQPMFESLREVEPTAAPAEAREVAAPTLRSAGGDR